MVIFQVLIYLVAVSLILSCSIAEYSTIEHLNVYQSDDCFDLFCDLMTSIRRLIIFSMLLEVAPMLWSIRTTIEPLLLVQGNKPLRMELMSLISRRQQVFASAWSSQSEGASTRSRTQIEMSGSMKTAGKKLSGTKRTVSQSQAKPNYVK